ncbi:hypothetical protein FLAVO9R_40144 [Flavobacterium sp. 9R]|nr:hypothetical protein FLAVO9R_40144 [Flavobacterium sp. 9R]
MGVTKSFAANRVTNFVEIKANILAVIKITFGIRKFFGELVFVFGILLIFIKKL